MTAVFRRLALLPLLLVLGFVGWSGYWVYAQARIEKEIDSGIGRLKFSGGDFACEDRRWAGYPLRLELSCASSELDVPDGPRIETERLEATSYLHRPRQITARVDRIAAEGAPNWSFRGRNIAVAAAGERPDRLEFSLSGEALRFADGRMAAVAVNELEVEGSIEGLPRTRSSDVGELLKEAARLGSEVNIDSFKVEMAEIRLTATGTVKLGLKGPSGTLSTTVTNYDDLMAELERRGVVSKKAARASTMLIGLLQGGSKKPGEEVTVALRFHEGQVFWGPFAVAEIPALE